MVVDSQFLGYVFIYLASWSDDYIKINYQQTPVILFLCYLNIYNFFIYMCDL